MVQNGVADDVVKMVIGSLNGVHIAHGVSNFFGLGIVKERKRMLTKGENTLF